ncbi:MAG: ABC-2 type transport system ATP-binding protein [Acidimicrobiales bacterium]|jgi:ABC-2 type transport system ATP-binding protein
MNLAIEVSGLTKSYKTKSGDTVDAVKGIDLHVNEGEILAFLGSNGAGKTTTIEILEGFRERTSGNVQVLGEDPEHASRTWREDIGIVLQESAPDRSLTAHESVSMYASFYDAPRPVHEVLEIVGLTDSAGQRTKALSGGQKRRLDLAIALVGDPKLVFLDEPTTGFDPSARREAWEMIEQLRSVGTTVLLTTHYMDEAEHLADRIVVISNGLISAEGTAADLAEQVKLLTRIAWNPAEVPAEALPDLFRSELQTTTEELAIETTEVTAVVHALTGWATTNGSRIDSLSVMRPNLEDTFLRLNAGDTQ